MIAPVRCSGGKAAVMTRQTQGRIIARSQFQRHESPPNSGGLFRWPALGLTRAFLYLSIYFVPGPDCLASAQEVRCLQLATFPKTSVTMLPMYSINFVLLLAAAAFFYRA